MKRIVIFGSRDTGSKNDPSVVAVHLKNEGNDVILGFWEDLVFDIATDDIKVLLNEQDIARDIRPDLVIALGWYKTSELAYYRDIAFTTALYLDKAGIRFWNSEMKQQRSTTKLSCMVQLALEGIPIPHTWFSLKTSFVLPKLPFIVKAIAASRGKDNYLVETEDEARVLLESSTPYVVQPFLPNDHDLRVVCFDSKPALVLRRSRGKNTDSHLNNTSRGGEAHWVDATELDERLLTLVKRISILLGREMGGVDLIPDVTSPYGYSCLEVNAVPQLTSGFDTKKKLDSLTQTINEMEVAR